MKRHTLLLFLLVAASSLFAATPLETFLKSPSIAPESTAVIVQDLSTGETLISHNPVWPSCRLPS